MNRTLLITSTMFSVAALSSAALAQVIPNSARPDTVERQYRIEGQRPTVGGAPLISMPEQEAKSIAGGVKFKLVDIRLEGATQFKADTLRPLYEKKLGTQVTLSELNAIAADITAYYRNRGYILTRAVVPPQRAQGGIVTIRIVEGFVNDVKIQGDRADDPQIRKYADKIRASKPLDAKALERYLLLMEDLPGVEARAVLQPSAATPGSSDVIVTITRKPIEFSASLDNRGSRFLGPLQASANLFANDILGIDEQTQFRFANSLIDENELTYGEIRQEHQLGSEGTKLLLSGVHVKTNPGHTVEILDIEGESTALTVGVTHPILRSRQSNWFVNSDLTARNVSVETFAGDLYYDKTRVLTVGTAYDFLDSTSAVNRMEANVAKGFGVGTGINKGRSRNNANGTFEKFAAKASRIQPISGPWSIYGAVSGQYSLDPLLASEEFALGGSEFGSAYDSAEITGDSGIATRLELQFNQGNEGAWLSEYQIYGFYDIGRVWNQDIIAASEDDHASLSSTGLGVRFNLLDSVTGGLEGAIPLTRDVAAMGTDGDDARLFFNLQYRY